MKIVFFTFYYPPDLGAGSFRSSAFAKELSFKIKEGDELHIITTHPNRYAAHKVKAEDFELIGNIKIYRIATPPHNSGVLSQIKAFLKYFLTAQQYSKKINPDLIIGTSSRLMTGILTWSSAKRIKCKYFIDIRDIFSETISDLYSRRNRVLGKVLNFIFCLIEKKILTNAIGVNVVSEGFPPYFLKKGIDVSNWSYFPNGIDKEFQNLKLKSKKERNNLKKILYVGNVGYGQGLDNVLPDVAKMLEGKYQFIIIGDGGKYKTLLNKIKDKEANNVTLIPPVGRKELLSFYHDADILFLHLNDFSAFRRVLPSKIFEYITFKKPIVAGLKGHSAEFLKKNISHVEIFDPCNVNYCVEAIKRSESLKINDIEIDLFIKNYSREKIMKDMGDHILKLL